MAFILPSLLDQAIAASDDPDLAASVRGSITPQWISLNASVGTQLSNMPNLSPASATRYVWDSGTLQSISQSLGPVLTERAETLGTQKFLFAVTNQSYSFDTLDKLDLRGFRVAYKLDSIVPGPTKVPGLVVADAYINISLNATTAHFAYGVTHWMDASFALPMVRSATTVRGGAFLRRSTAPGALLTLPTQFVNISSTGLGDGVLRLKARSPRRTTRHIGAEEQEPWTRRIKLALATDFRLPLGNEFDYHGAGAYGIRPFLIASMTNKVISPHLNVGYQWNGRSYLASQYPTEKKKLPGSIFYAAGFDAALSQKVTFSLDLLDQIIIGGQRTLLRPLTAADGTSFTEIHFDDITRHEINAAAGLKIQLGSRLMACANVQLKLNQAGLRTRVAPMVGLAYLF